MHTLIASKPKIHISPNEAYASVQLQLHKPESDEVHFYEELNSSVTPSQGTVTTARNEAYGWIKQSIQTY